MRLELKSGDTALVLTARTVRGVCRLAEAAGALLAAAPDEAPEDKPEFGFGAGNSVHAEIAEEWRWPAQVATRLPRIPRR